MVRRKKNSERERERKMEYGEIQNGQKKKEKKKTIDIYCPSLISK